VTEREEESKLVWKAVPDDAWIEVKIAEKGWGTNVSVKAENGSEPTKLEGWLDAVLDELATPTKRPFEGMTETPSGTLADAVKKKPEPALVASPTEESPVVEPVPEKPEPPEPAAEEPRAPEPAPDPAPKKRRGFFSRFF
jgi:outer membrane biosynthesis protein TonB